MSRPPACAAMLGLAAALALGLPRVAQACSCLPMTTAEAYDKAGIVQLVQVESTEEEPPPPGRSHGTRVGRYRVLQSFKARGPAPAVLRVSRWWQASSCSNQVPWFSTGEVLLVFIGPDGELGPCTHSRRFDPDGADASAVLQALRQLGGLPAENPPRPAAPRDLSSTP